MFKKNPRKSKDADKIAAADWITKLLLNLMKITGITLVASKTMFKLRFIMAVCQT